MKVLKTKTVKFEGEKEKIKLVELNNRDRKKYNSTYNYAVVFGCYNEIDMEADTLKEATEQFNNWGID